MKKEVVVKTEKEFDLISIIKAVIQVPGVKITRDVFLREQFKDLPEDEVELIIEKGPVEAGCAREELRKKARRIIKGRTTISAGASFAAGIPGGLAMAATIPADIMQFYGVALRMAQELVYLYGEVDIWCEGAPDPDKVTNQLILYCGVMLGASGAAQTVRIMSSALAKQALQKLPQKALTKTFYYPVIKSILNFFGVHITKKAFANGVYKVLPVVGGAISGGITFASMLPMGNRLVKVLEEAHFEYTMADFESDIKDISKVYTEVNEKESILKEICEAKKMLDEGIITEEEFAAIKAKLISE